MHRAVAWVLGIAQMFGGPGLFLIAFLDSSFLSFPEVVDLLLMGLVTQHKERVLWYALLPTLGSLAGCLVLYFLARKGGEAFLRKRFHERHVDKTMAIFQKYGLLAVAIPSILPPPIPFKPFVLAAGVAGVRPVDFIIAVLIGRGIRYFGEAFLALWYGDRAVAFLNANAKPIAMALAGTVIALAVGWTIWQRRRPRTP
ncbi:MAG TPA: VTT domain-containing protein [Vicinamibacterales bacterium]